MPRSVNMAVSLPVSPGHGGIKSNAGKADRLCHRPKLRPSVGAFLIALLAGWALPLNTAHAVLITNAITVALEDGSAPGGVTYNSFGTPSFTYIETGGFADRRGIAYYSVIDCGGCANDTAIYWGRESATPGVFAVSEAIREGDASAAPGSPVITGLGQRAALNARNANLLYRADINTGNPNNDTALFRRNAGDVHAILLQEGDSVGFNVVSAIGVNSFTVRSQAAGDGYVWSRQQICFVVGQCGFLTQAQGPAGTDTLQVSFNTNSGVSGIFRIDPEHTVIGSVSDNGTFSFVAHTQMDARDALWKADGAGTFDPILYETDPQAALGTLGAGWRVETGGLSGGPLSAPRLLVQARRSELVAFTANLQEGFGGVTVDNDEVLFIEDYTNYGSLRLVAREGFGAPSGFGELYTSFVYDSLSFSDVGAIFMAGTSGNLLRLFYTDLRGNVTNLLAFGDTLEVAPGDIRTVVGFATGPQSLDTRGWYAVRILFADGTEGIFILPIPEPSLWVMLLAAVLGIAALALKRRKNLLSTPRVTARGV